MIGIIVPLKSNRERRRGLYSSRSLPARVNAEKRQRPFRMAYSMYFIYSALLVLVLIFETAILAVPDAAAW